jgi:hypothetical protein
VVDPLARLCGENQSRSVALMTTVLNIGDYALHKTTGNLGQVVAYGYEMLDGAYLPTIKVEVRNNTGIKQRTFVEDLSNTWLPVEKDSISKNCA